MANLKHLKNRINSVKATKKITSAMKMVAASRFKTAEQKVKNARPFSAHFQEMLTHFMTFNRPADRPKFLTSENKPYKKGLIVILSSDRGLCAGLNTNLVRHLKTYVTAAKEKKIAYSFIIFGQKGYELLRYSYASSIFEVIENAFKEKITYQSVEQFIEKILSAYLSHDFDHLCLFYNYFQSAMTQKPISKIILPLRILDFDGPNDLKNHGLYETEPNEERMVEKLTKSYFKNQFYQAFLEAQASEYGARMTAMENATKNASEMIDNLTILYNRSRQATITKELIEIIAGAEAL